MDRIGVDLGGTKIEAVLLDDHLDAVSRKRIPTPHGSYDKVIESITGLVSEIRTTESSIGVCTPGAVSEQTGLIKNSNMQCLIGMPLKHDLEERLGQDILMENDANCFAMAEATMGAATGYGMVFGVIMGTGVGGGIIVDGKIHRGRTSIAGEWGHHILYRNGNQCYCGRKGCVETYISGPALEMRWEQLTGLRQSTTNIVSDLSGERAIQWKNEFLENFASALANVIDILDPDAIVLGGGVSNIPFLYDEGRDAVYERVFGDMTDTPILKNRLGDSAGVFGAGLLWG